MPIIIANDDALKCVTLQTCSLYLSLKLLQNMFKKQTNPNTIIKPTEFDLSGNSDVRSKNDWMINDFTLVFINISVLQQWLQPLWGCEKYNIFLNSYTHHKESLSDNSKTQGTSSTLVSTTWWVATYPAVCPLSGPHSFQLWASLPTTQTNKFLRLHKSNCGH